MTASTADELALAPIMAARTLIEHEPNYAYVSARLLLDKLRAEALSLRRMARRAERAQAEMADALRRILSRPTSRRGIEAELLDPGTGALRPDAALPRR